MNIAEKVYGKSREQITGKPRRKNETLRQTNLIEMPKELILKNKNVELSVDTMYVNNISFFATIIHDICYSTSQYLPNKNKQNYVKCLKEIIHIYERAGFNITTVHCD